MAYKSHKESGGSESKARDVKKTPGKSPKLPPMPAARGAKTATGTKRKVKGY